MTNIIPIPNEAVRVLLEGVVDYAGLFPPSKLSMPEAVLNYAMYKNSNYSWMLGRFILPVGRLDEFLDSAKDFFARDAKGAWHLSVIADDNIYETIRRVEDLNANNGPGVICDTLEIKVNSQEDIVTYTNAIPANFTNYFEIPVDDDLPDLVAALSINGQRAKIRTGGITPDLFPKTSAIIRFMRACLAANVPFKATAGLHHPLRCFKPLTYEANAPKGTMHGFLNVFLTAGFAREGFKPEVLEEVMEDEFAESFDFHEGGVSWHQDFKLTTAQLLQLRENGIISFGSCSFDEPIADLEKIGIL
ncbi:MAG: hypothetical protein KDB79_15215 [Acidobacteria bacterium]|nr:hypothetical protein [Acidobacteriota bacterium]